MIRILRAHHQTVDSGIADIEDHSACSFGIEFDRNIQSSEFAYALATDNLDRVYTINGVWNCKLEFAVSKCGRYSDSPPIG